MPAPETLSTQTPGAAPAAPDTSATTNTTTTTDTTTDTASEPAFKPLHKGGGKYVVVGADGEPVGEFKGPKAEAEAEAARLIAGGEPLVAPAAPAHELADSAPAAQAKTDAIDPTTLKQPVLTSEGWVCPAPKREA
ncbi:hypothetical protein ACOQNP_23945 [Ectopseudomonas khazarica]|uniref:hypothetical protein n=1 Tax=Ectopseudomonas khazarica TaxID=2502979 RepID=UPI003B94A5A7